MFLWSFCKFSSISEVDLKPAPVKTPQSSSQSVQSSVPAPPISKPPTPAAKSEPKVASSAATSVPEKVVKPQPPAPELPKNIADLEKAVESAALTAIQEYNKAVNILKR